MQAERILYATFFILLCTNGSNSGRFKLIQKFQREWQVKKDHVVTYDRSMGKREGTFLYAACDPSTPNVLDCTFVLDNLFSYLRDSRANMTCHLKFHGNDNKQLFRNITVERFVTDSIFVALPVKEGADHYDEYGFIHMPDCHQTKLRQVEDFKFAKFVLYRNTFDVIDYKNPSCDHNLCRLHHSQDGRASDELSFAANLNPWSIQPVSYDDDSDGFFVLSDNDTSPLVASLVTKSGEVKPLISIPKSAAQYWYPRYATNRLSVCWTPEATKYFSVSGNLHCTQYAYSKELGLQKVLDKTIRERLDDTTILSLYNLAEGGLLVLTGKCETDDDPWKKFSCRNMKALLNTADGNVYSYDLPRVAFGCQPIKDSVSVDIKQESYFNFNFAAICSDPSSEFNTITFKRVVMAKDNYMDSHVLEE